MLVKFLLIELKPNISSPFVSLLNYRWSATIHVQTLMYLVHAGLVEPHDRGVGQPVKHSPQGLLGVKLLRLEQLLEELLIEHGRDDVIHDCHITGHRGYRTFTSELGMEVHHREVCLVIAERSGSKTK